jgi:hypothetical protein
MPTRQSISDHAPSSECPKGSPKRAPLRVLEASPRCRKGGPTALDMPSIESISTLGSGGPERRRSDRLEGPVEERGFGIVRALVPALHPPACAADRGRHSYRVLAGEWTVAVVHR